MSTLITIAMFSNVTELSIARGRLETEGIECVVLDEYVTQAMPIYTTGVRLQVKEEDVPRAMEILKQYGYKTDNAADLPKDTTGMKFIIIIVVILVLVVLLALLQKK